MTSRLILSFLLLNIFTIFNSNAQVTRAFDDRVSFNVNGNITMAGNTLMTCDTSTSNSCNGVRSGTLSGSNNRDMIFVNVDSAAGYSNSSSASLTIPNGATVLHAELYWSGRHDANANNRDRIRIKAPGSGSYVRVTAHTVDTFPTEGESGSRPYQASADVTQIVGTAGSGSYTVADLRAKTGIDGLGYYGGWAMAVVYQDNSQPFRRLMLFDGAAKVVGNNTVSITTDNLVTPYSGNFNTYLGALVWEGDQSITGDAFVFEGTTLNDSLNPANNFWNSSITSFNSRVTTKNPDYVNQLAMDLVMTDVSGLLSNGKTQANIDFVSDGDSYFPHVLAFVTDLYLPDFASSMDKTAIDLNGGQVEPGDVIEYRIAFENTGQDVAINTVVTDALPVGLTYADHSLEIISASAGPAGAMSDLAGDDNAEYDANNRTITFWVGNNSGPNQGGDFMPGESALVRFFATVDNQSSGSLSNTATIDFNAQTTPNNPLSANDDAIINVVATAGINVTKTAQLTIDNGNPGTADAGDEITFSISVENTGNLSMSNIALNDAMAPLGVTCPSNSLAPYSSMNCDSYSYTVTQNDMNTGGTIDNTVNLTAVDGASGNHQDSDSTQTTITLLPPVISSPSDAALLNDNTPTVSGTGQPGVEIDVLTDQGGSCQTIVNAQGNWSCVISPALSDGIVIISAFASDGGSNQSATTSVTVELDSQAPTAPGIDAPTNGQPVTGTGEPGATVTVTTGNGDSCTAVVQANGTWSCDLGPNVVDGDTITATQEDEAGNISDPTIVPGGIDTQAPAVTITAPANGELTNNNTPTVAGTSEAGAEISVTIAGVEVCSAIADGNGDWSCDVSPAIADGTIQIDVTATDAAGNSSNPESVSIEVDTMAPAAPSIDTPSNGQPVTGSGGEPGATIDVTTPGGASCSATVQGDGSWSCTLTGNLVNGDDITATQTDAAGNTSDPTTVSGGLDTQAPAVTITAPANGELTNNNTPTVAGTSEAGAEISVTIAGVEVCSAIADGNGDWSCDVSPAIADGTIQIDVTATDAAGNSSNPESVSIEVDTMAPAAPSIDTPSNGQPVTGSGGEPGATIDVTTPGGASCSATVQGDGSWSCTLTGNLVNGDDITATQTDAAGNTSDPTTVSGGLDTQAPDAPSIVTPVIGTTINNASPLISGTAEPDSTVTVSNQNGVICVAQTDNLGQWSCTPNSPLADGIQQLQAVARDVAGNDSLPGTTSFTVNSGASYTLAINGPDELTTTEAGGTDSFTIVLPLTPTADVTVNISSSDTTEGTVAPSSVTFTTANWNQPVTITVTGVDDNDYDLDQPYTVDFSPLSSQDSNYNGVQVASLDAVNEDDDAQPDLSVFMTNCIDGSLPQQPITYYLTVSNEGNKAIQGARLTTLFPQNITTPNWDCATHEGLACIQATGQGDLDELIDLDVNESMMFTMTADVDGELHDFIDVRTAIAMPSGDTDINPANNQAEDSDLLYQFLYKDGFECAAPGTIESTTLQLEQLLNLQ